MGSEDNGDAVGIIEGRAVVGKEDGFFVGSV